MAAQAAKPIERWMASRRVAVMVSILKGEISVEKVEDWRENFLLGAEDALRSLASFGTMRFIGAPALPSDNDLIFQSRRFRQAC